MEGKSQASVFSMIERRTKSLWPDPRYGVVRVFFERQPRIFAFFSYYLLAWFVGYFSIIAASSWLGFSGIHAWFSWWRPLEDLLAAFLPAFHNIEHALVGTKYRDQVATIHHLLTFGWLTSIVVIAATAIVAAKAPRDQWRRVASLHSRWWLASAGLFLLLLLSAFVTVLAIAPLYGFMLWLGAWHRSEVQLVLMGLCFYGMVVITVGMFIAFGASLVSRSDSDVPRN